MKSVKPPDNVPLLDSGRLVESDEKVAPLVRQLPWSHNLIVLGQFSPALVADYQTKLLDKKLLQAKLHELYALTETETETE